MGRRRPPITRCRDLEGDPLHGRLGRGIRLPDANLHNHTGIFIDDPNNNDITGLSNTLFGRTRNRVFYNTLLWDLGGEKKKFRIGVEFTFRKTEYKDPASTGRLPNSGFGIHPQFQWLF